MCDQNNYTACYELGRIYLNGDNTDKNYKKSIELFKKGCDGDNGLSCTFLAIQHHEGIGTEKDRIKSISLLHKSCDKLKERISCGVLADWYVLKEDYVKVGFYREIACALGLDIACQQALYDYQH